MTDKDIIQALECCADLYDCTDCPCKEFCGDLGILQQNALDLINRQQAEIEWKTTYMHSLQVSMEEIKPRIKAEAIKEFADILKNKLTLVDVTTIDNLVKEMLVELITVLV